MPLELRFKHQWDLDRRRRRLEIGLPYCELFVTPDQIGRLLPARRAALVGIFDNDAHAGGLHVPADLAENPNARIVHRHERADTLARREAQHRYHLARWRRIAVECDHAQLVAGERYPVYFAGAGIEHVQQHALTLLDSQWLTRSHDFAIDGGDFVARVHGTVVASQHVAAPIVQREEKLLIVASGLIAGLDHQEAMLSAILPARQITHRHRVRVVPAKAGRARYKGITRHGIWRDRRRTFLDASISVHRRKQAVPMHNLLAVIMVRDFDGHWPALLQTQYGARNLAVVGNGFELMTR